MRNVSWSRPGRRAGLAGLAVTWLVVAFPGVALAADFGSEEAVSAPAAPAAPAAPTLTTSSGTVDPGTPLPAHEAAVEHKEGLSAGAWLGIAVSIVIAVALLLGALPLILPKPPGSRSRH